MHKFLNKRGLSIDSEEDLKFNEFIVLKENIVDSIND